MIHQLNQKYDIKNNGCCYINCFKNILQLYLAAILNIQYWPNKVPRADCLTSSTFTEVSRKYID